MKHPFQIIGSFALATACCAQMASANDREDCGSSNPDLAISGCSAVIDAGNEAKENIAVAYRLRAVAYVKKGNSDLAIKDYDKLIELYPKNANSYFNRAIAYEKLGNARSAASDYRRVLSLRPNDKTAIEALQRLDGTP